jgi:organic hydroperoxide reductase OsmC/OhrA
MANQNQSASHLLTSRVMQPFPHRYLVSAAAGLEGEVVLESERLPKLLTTLPAEFGGPGGLWSPEALLVASVADCYVLTFRGIAARSSLAWISLVCEASGTLDRIDRVTRFTGFHVQARLQVPEGTNTEQATRLLAKAEETCLITRSLSAAVSLDTSVETLAEQHVE